MNCTELSISHLRNHGQTSLPAFGSKFNILIGPNGAGKTSIIEALSISALTKSFTGALDSVLVSSGASQYAIDARFLSDNNVPLHVSINWTSGPPARKTIVLNNDKIRRSSDLVGRIPIVALTPDDKIVTSGSPEERRRFLSIVLSQASNLYLEDEIELRKALKHRNSLLSDCRQRNMPLASARGLIAPWTEVVIERSSRIMSRRAAFISEFRPILEECYRNLSTAKETPSLRYLPMNLEEETTDFRSLLEREFQKLEGDELRRATTLAGAHRDELILYIDDKREARRYASQGQHKTLLVSMKLAEFNYLADATGETPILLLDDVFSELDAERSKQLLAIISTGDFGQVFITSTTRESFTHLIEDADGKVFTVVDGIVR